MPRPPFNLLRACFYLLAVILIVEVLASIGAGVMCWWTNITDGRIPGACLPVGEQIRELWSEVLTAILALLLAARRPPDDDSEP